MPSYFPENNDPKPMDSADRSLQKINSILTGGISVSGSDVEVTNGQSGGRYIADTNLYNGSWYAVQVLADAKFHTLTGNITGIANTTEGSAPVIPAGTILYGAFTAIDLHSGRIVAYDS
jgi:hypothetical protein